MGKISTMIELKKKVMGQLETLLTERIRQMQLQLSQLRDDSAGSSKSSMGDKYETTREMLKQEEEKIGQQLVKCQKELQLVINQKDSAYQTAQLGSLVRSAEKYFLLLIGLGPLKVEGYQIFVISPASPIGQSLLNKGRADSFHFNRSNHEIEEIC